jgi:hypothetical protein
VRSNNQEQKNPQIKCTISGRCLREAKGVSVMKLLGIASQPLLIRVNRSNKIVSTGMVMVQ